MKKTIIILSVFFVLILSLGLTSLLIDKNDAVAYKTVLIEYKVDGESEPFDTYYMKYKPGEKVRVVSPILEGYECRMPVYSGTVKTDVYVSIIYDLHPPVPALPQTGVLSAIDFETNEDWQVYLKTGTDRLYLNQSGTSGDMASPAMADIVDGTFHVEDRSYLVFRDNLSVFDEDSFTITFSMMFEEFWGTDKTQAFTFMYSTTEGYKRCEVFCLDSEGNLFVDGTMQMTLQTYKWYTFTVHVYKETVDEVITRKTKLFVNSEDCGMPSMANHRDGVTSFFNFFDPSSRVKYYMDNFYIYRGAPVKIK